MNVAFDLASRRFMALEGVFSERMNQLAQDVPLSGMHGGMSVKLLDPWMDPESATWRFACRLRAPDLTGPIGSDTEFYYAVLQERPRLMTDEDVDRIIQRLARQALGGLGACTALEEE